MSNVVQGKDVIIEMLVEGIDFQPILCGTDCSFSRVPDIIPITTTSSGLFPESMIRREGWSMNVSGLTKIANAASLTFFYMLQTAVRRLAQTVRVTFTDDEGADVQISGNVLIGQMDISGPYSDFAQSSIEFKGTGGFTITPVTPPVPIDFEYLADWWQTTNGHNYIDGASSGQQDGTPYTLGANDTLIEVDVEGTEFDIITSGTPVGRECKFNTSTFVITFPVDLIFDGSQRVYVEFKRAV